MEGWKPTVSLLSSGRVVCDPLGLLVGEREKWQDLWQSASSRVSRDVELRSATMLYTLVVLRAASSKFSVHIACAPSDFHPRHFAMMSDS